MFENELIRGIHCSRYIASWHNVGGNRRLFGKWLRQLIVDGEPLTEDEVRRIIAYAENGKCELEANIERFIISGGA